MRALRGIPNSAIVYDYRLLVPRLEEYLRLNNFIRSLTIKNEFMTVPENILKGTPFELPDGQFFFYDFDDNENYILIYLDFNTRKMDKKYKKHVKQMIYGATWGSAASFHRLNHPNRRNMYHKWDIGYPYRIVNALDKYENWFSHLQEEIKLLLGGEIHNSYYELEPDLQKVFYKDKVPN